MSDGGQGLISGIKGTVNDPHARPAARVDGNGKKLAMPFGANSRAMTYEPLPYPYAVNADATGRVRPHHDKVRTLFDRIMAQDNSVYKELFRPYARRIIWFGENCGKVQTPDQAAPFPRPTGPVKYWNRLQYFGDHVFVETHTAVRQGGESYDLLVVCELDDEGYIIKFEEFGDPALLALGPRPIPAPQTPPDQVRIFQGKGEPHKMLEMSREWFTYVMERKDVGHLFTGSAQEPAAGQMTRTFATENGAWEGRAVGIGWNKKGGLYVGPPPGSRPDMEQYTLRRNYSGEGWAVELHTAGGKNPRAPERRYGYELGILFQADYKGSEKFQELLEYADCQVAPRRMEDVAIDGRRRLSAKL